MPDGENKSNSFKVLDPIQIVVIRWQCPDLMCKHFTEEESRRCQGKRLAEKFEKLELKKNLIKRQHGVFRAWCNGATSGRIYRDFGVKSAKAMVDGVKNRIVRDTLPRKSPMEWYEMDYLAWIELSRRMEALEIKALIDEQPVLEETVDGISTG